MYAAGWASQAALAVKNLPASAGDIEMWVQSLGQGDPLEWEMATHSSTLAWRVPWTEEPGGLQSTGLHNSQTCLSTLQEGYGGCRMLSMVVRCEGAREPAPTSRRVLQKLSERALRQEQT